MAIISRCLAVAAAFTCVKAARFSKKAKPSAKFIAGIQVLNYDAGEVTILGAERDWNLVMKTGATDLSMKSLCNSKACKLEGHPDKGGFAFVTFKGSEESLRIKLEKEGTQVKYVELDSEVRMTPELEATNIAPWGLERVGVPLSTQKGLGVNVYVLDTGVRSSHADFGGRAAPAIDVSSSSLEECPPVSPDSQVSSTCARDSQGHGTHCAGTVGGSLYGVAPEASIFGGKVMSDSGRGQTSWIMAALDWCATTGARPAVASMSLGGPGQSAGLKEAVDAAVNAGVVVVVAGGNDNTDACNFSPAFVPMAITVGSTTRSDSRSSFSNYGSCTDIWAPGSDITSASHRTDTGSATMSGTSMACPHVSGAVALALQVSPSLSSEQVLEQLLDNSVPGAISGLFMSDTNALLWVGDSAAPPSPQAPAVKSCPAFASTRLPLSNGDCKCGRGTYCSLDGGASFWNCPTADGIGGGWGAWFNVDCEECRCF